MVLQNSNQRIHQGDTEKEAEGTDTEIQQYL